MRSRRGSGRNPLVAISFGSLLKLILPSSLPEKKGQKIQRRRLQARSHWTHKILDLEELLQTRL